jgi:methionine aminopeptidase
MAIQDFGGNFNLTKLYFARDVARELTYELSSLIRPGMQEEDALSIYHKLCSKYSVDKQWHPPKIRFGPNTVCNFKENSLPYVLKEEDIFFIDIGLVVEGHEADYGETFVTGDLYDHKLIANASKKIFEQTSYEWACHLKNGPLLYNFAKIKAHESGFRLNDESDGHRIGDFPHKLFFRGGITECDEQLIPNAWILEIHLWMPDKSYGAFFEDILTIDH